MGAVKNDDFDGIKDTSKLLYRIKSMIPCLIFWKFG